MDEIKMLTALVERCCAPFTEEEKKNNLFRRCEGCFYNGRRGCVRSLMLDYAAAVKKSLKGE
jgi:hypothetical protein